MSKPLSADQLIAAFRKWGVPFVERPNWRTHNRNSKGAWGPVNGLILHHTGDDAPDTADIRVLWDGRSDLPGPLCHWGMRDDGVAVMIGNGRANHAGLGSSLTLSKVVSENYQGSLVPGPDDTDGNTHFYGQETMYSGGHAMTDKAYKSTVLAFAAVCDAHGWSGKSCIGHREWTRTKWDPGSLDMAKFRDDVNAALKAGPGNWPTKDKPALNPGIHKMRLQVRAFLTAANRRPAIKAAAAAFDNVLAKYERSN